jgi:hypothetical protein
MRAARYTPSASIPRVGKSAQRVFAASLSILNPTQGPVGSDDFRRGDEEAVRRAPVVDRRREPPPTGMVVDDARVVRVAGGGDASGAPEVVQAAFLNW